VKIKFLRACQIGVAGTRGHKLFVVADEIRGVFNGKSFLPIGPVAIFDAQGNGGSDGFAVTHAGEDFGAIFLDLLASTAAVAELSAVEFMIDEIDVNREGSGKAGDEGEERLSVGFTGSVEAKHGNLEEAV
jgi:hypothetical protein